ncbi:MAG: phospholipid carrier-dependent glycosyltransferase [Candidatus Acidiferrales bacterium]
MITPSAKQIAAGTLVLAVLAICLFGHLGAIGLTGPDEPRYASIARDMARSGDWVTPRLYGQPWFEKPILYYWSAGIFFCILPGNEWPARLPSAIAALAAALSLAWLARKFYGSSAGFTTLLIFPTCVGVVGFARAATPDMLFASALTLAMAASACVLARSNGLWEQDAPAPASLHSRWAEITFGISLGLAALAKGPAALLLAPGAVVAWALVTRRWRAAFRLASIPAILSFCIVALPWYILCARRNPSLVRTFLLEHNFERYLTPVFQHRQPVWFFIPILAIGLLPWSALLAVVFHDARSTLRERRWRNSPGLLFAIWAAVPFVFFSFSQSKLPGYILPSIAPLVLLLAASTAKMSRKQTPMRWPLRAVAVTWLGMCVSFPLLVRRLPPGAPGDLLIWIRAGCVGAAVTGILVFSLARKRNLALLTTALAAAIGVEYTSLSILPRLDPYISARTVAEETTAASENSIPLYTFGISRAWVYGLSFYLDSELREWEPKREGSAVVFTTESGMMQLESSGRTVRLNPGRRSGVLSLTIEPLSHDP